MTLLETTIKSISAPDAAARAKAMQRQDNLTKPHGSLGRLEELSVQVAGIRGEIPADLPHKAVVTMAADHGVAAQGVSLYPSEVTQQMVLNIAGGGAAINVLCRQAGARVVLVNMGVAGELPDNPNILHRPVAAGTADFSRGPAMSREQAVQCLETGIDIINQEIAKGLDIVGTGEMGIGNTTAASAVTTAITGHPPAEVTGRGTGVDDDQLKHKASVIAGALEVNRPDGKDALDVLAKVGGFEIGGLAGIILGAAANRVPVVIDGFISGAAALIACGLAPITRDYLIFAHLSVEKGHRVILEHLKAKPVLDLDMRLGEGTGAALGITITCAAVKILAEMATFAEAGVSEAE
jgi:nicotinate-nucleotide--dimethylbenzimidazole phosphoribosyltransferase